MSVLEAQNRVNKTMVTGTAPVRTGIIWPALISAGHAGNRTYLPIPSLARNSTFAAARSC